MFLWTHCNQEMIFTESLHKWWKSKVPLCAILSSDFILLQKIFCNSSHNQNTAPPWHYHFDKLGKWNEAKKLHWRLLANLHIHWHNSHPEPQWKAQASIYFIKKFLNLSNSTPIGQTSNSSEVNQIFFLPLQKFTVLHWGVVDEIFLWNLHKKVILQRESMF